PKGRPHEDFDWSSRSGPPARPGAPSRRTLILVDQRLDMFYGARRSMKSVAAAEAAAFCAWRFLERGDPVGGLVFNDAPIESIEAEASAEGAMRFIETIAAQNAELRAGSTQPRDPTQLDSALSVAAADEDREARRIIIVSDFRGHGPSTREILAALAAHNEVL